MIPRVIDPDNRTAIALRSFTVRELSAPLSPELTWLIESFLLKVFEYGNFSFRAALRGQLSSMLCCTFYIATDGDQVVGAAGCLHSSHNQPVALFGPIAVEPQYRRSGIGTSLATMILEYLMAQDCRAVYLGVIGNNPARRLYEKVGFENYQGIIMRRLFGPPGEFEASYFQRCSQTTVKQADWADYCNVQVLLASPCSMYAFDYLRGGFSSRYAPPHSFLPQFPSLMKTVSAGLGLANVLVTGPQANVVGISHITRPHSAPLRHAATLDFFIHDNFVDQADELLYTTIRQAQESGVSTLNCFVPEGDQVKRSIMKRLNATQTAVLPESVRLNGHHQNTLVYKCRATT